jgi:hypothetical protein
MRVQIYIPSVHEDDRTQHVAAAAACRLTACNAIDMISCFVFSWSKARCRCEIVSILPITKSIVATNCGVILTYVNTIEQASSNPRVVIERVQVMMTRQMRNWKVPGH